METTEKVIAGAFVTVVGVSMLGSCSDNRKARAQAQYNSQASLVSGSKEVRGAEGIVNLNEVREAFRATHEMAIFEQRVNEIYEGEQLIVFEAKEVKNGFQLLAREDLDGSKTTSSSDDLLFTLSVKGREATLKGAGANSFYNETWLYEAPPGAAEQVREVRHSSFASSPFFWWWMLSPGWGGYYTPGYRYDSMYSHRGTYRSSRAYRDQVSRNGSYTKRNASSFRGSSKTMSSQRKSYVKKMPSTSGYKQKMAASARKTGSGYTSQSRSSGSKKSSFFGSSRKSSSSGGFGGFRGSSGF